MSALERVRKLTLTFCRDMNGTSHLERAEFKRKPSKTIQLSLELREVGEERHPTTVTEVKVLLAEYSALENGFC